MNESPTPEVFLRREAIAAGYTDRQIARQLAAGYWHRIRHGAYCFTADWAAATRQERHLILAEAVLRTTPGEVALSHTTALLAHGIPVWGADLSRVHVTRLDNGSKRRQRDVDHHVGRIDPATEVMIHEGRPVVVPARAVIEAAGIMKVESGLVSADGALHAELCTPEDLYAVHEQFGHWPGQQRVGIVVNLADGRSESAGETRGRFLFRWAGLPRPELQHSVVDASGRLIAVTDWWWPESRVFGEFDGKVKYCRYLRPGEQPGDAVFREKRREDMVRAVLNARCVRLTWPDFAHRRDTAARVAEALGVRPRFLWAG